MSHLFCFGLGYSARALAGGLGVEDEVTNENENSSTGAEEAHDGD